MNKLLIAASFLSFGWSLAQNISEADRASMTWYHNDLGTSKIYGINSANAYKFLESKGLKPKTVIVGVLDSGVEVNHPGLVNNIWTNPNEVPNNGKDDDKNGYIDDIHGWNFLGGKNGDVGTDNLEITRVVRKYEPIFEGPNSATNKANQSKMPDEFAMYMYSKEAYNKKSVSSRQNYQTYKMIQEAIPEMVSMLNGKNLTTENLATIKPTNQKQAIGLRILSQLAESPEAKGKSPKEVQDFLNAEMGEAVKHFESEAKQYDKSFDPRSIVGDNYDDINEKYYGNNNYEGPDAAHGTHVAGIIAGYANGNNIQYGIASKVAKIMSVRAVPDGDERDKDVANAVRYAVDNGAKILNMSFGKAVSPDKKTVWDAFKYAEQKGVLLVHAAGNENEDLGVASNYPTNYYKMTDTTPFINNMITVGASTGEDVLKAGFSNYNKTMVDVFAPGAHIYSTVPDAKYEYFDGTSMASPVVAGAAAVLLAYMPNLTPSQIIESFKMTVNKPTGGDFGTYSSSGGVIDLAKAAEYAYTRFYNSKNSSASTPAKANKKVRSVK